MSGVALALVVTAALLHAVWNTLAKRGGDPFLFLWCAVAVSSLPLVPVIAWLVWRGYASVEAAPYMLATVCVHGVYFYALGRSYHHGDLSTVYPIARGLAVALVPVGAAYVYQESLSTVGLVGIATVVIGIVVVGRAGAPGRLRLGPGAGWALLTGCCTATYSLVDRGGVAHASPVVYMAVIHGGVALLLAPVVWERRAQLGAVVHNRGRVLLAGFLMFAGYTLVLFAFRLSKTGYVVAARELSIVASTIIGAWLLREGRVARRLSGAAMIFIGVICIAFAE